MFITTIHSIDSLEKLKRAKADAVIIGVEHYSIRSCITVKKEDLQLWKKKCKKLGLKLYINFLRLCMDEDLSGVREYFSIFKELDVADFAFSGNNYVRLYEPPNKQRWY